MSVVVAIKRDNKIYIGADSQVTKGWTRSSLSNPNNYKVWKVDGVDNCLMAHCGTVSEANVIKVAEKLVPEVNVLKNTVDFKCMVKNVVPSIFKELKNANFECSRDGHPAMHSEFLFAYKDKLFNIGGDGCVIEVDDYCAIGSGSEPALGSLLTTENEIPEERIKKAIKASATSDIFVDYPIIMIDTDGMEFRVFEEADLR